MKRGVIMKIISGFLKGRNIEGYDIAGTRPTMDRVKESLFAMINPNIKDSICLDLFAGSGNLGFEAISNGAKLCYANDKNIKCVKVINKNIKTFALEEKIKVLNLDYQKCLNLLSEENVKFDIIFLDPPYRNECLNDVVEYLLKNDLLKENGLIICEVDNDYLKRDYDELEVIKNRKYGDKFIIIYKKTSLKKTIVV